MKLSSAKMIREVILSIVLIVPLSAFSQQARVKDKQAYCAQASKFKVNYLTLFQDLGSRQENPKNTAEVNADLERYFTLSTEILHLKSYADQSLDLSTLTALSQLTQKMTLEVSKKYPQQKGDGLDAYTPKDEGFEVLNSCFDSEAP